MNFVAADKMFSCEQLDDYNRKWPYLVVWLHPVVQAIINHCCIAYPESTIHCPSKSIRV